MKHWQAVGYSRTEYSYDGMEPPEDVIACLDDIEAETAHEARLIALHDREFADQVADDRIDGVNPLGSIIVAPAVLSHDGCPYNDPPDDEEANAALTCPVCDPIMVDVERRRHRLEVRRHVDAA